MGKLNRSATALALTTCLTAPQAFADDFTVEAPISGVTVYRDAGAVVTRQVTLDVPAGRHRIMIPGLSADMDEDYGLRAAVAAGSARVSNTEMDERYTESAAYGRRAALEEQLRTLTLEQKQDRAKVEAIDMQLEFLKKLGAWTGGQAPEGFSSPDDMINALERSYAFVRESGSAALADQIALENAMEDRGREMQAVRRQLDNLGDGQVSIIEATVSLDAASAGPVTLSLTYQVEAAEWNLTVDADLNTSDGTTEITLFGEVEQYTDEDWSGVPLLLSTSSPSDEIAPDMPEPTYYNLQEPLRILARESRLEKVAAEPAPYDNVEEVVVTAQNIASASTEFDVEFTVEGLVTVPADGTTQRFELGGAQTSGDLVVRTSPRDNEAAFLFADSRFNDIPVLNLREVVLTRDGTYVGAGEWPQLVPGELLKLPYGFDDRVDIQVITVPSEDGDTGIFNRRQVEESKTRFVVTNNHATAYTVELFDQRPNSMNEDLEIETLRGSTRPTETDVDGQPGVMMWRKQLAPGEVWEINHWYRLTYPADKRLVTDRP